MILPYSSTRRRQPAPRLSKNCQRSRDIAMVFNTRQA